MARQQDEYQREESGRQVDATRAPQPRWQLVQFLRDRGDWVSEATLADALAVEASDRGPAVWTAAGASTSDGDVGESVYRFLIQLHHVHLPKLAEAGVVVWNQTDRVVRIDKSAITDREKWASSAALDGADGRVLDDPQRRRTLAVVGAASEPVSRARLARELTSTDGEPPSETAVENVDIRLHHCHLPKLEEAGLIHYDHDEASVSYCGPSTLPVTLPTP